VTTEALNERQAGMCDIVDVRLRLDLRKTTATPAGVVRMLLKALVRRTPQVRCLQCVWTDPDDNAAFEPGRRGGRA